MNRYALERAFVPNPSLRILARLGKTMLRDKPPPELTNEVVEKHAGRLFLCLAEVDAAQTMRVRETNPEIVASEGEFDRGTDTWWIWFRKLLEGWANALGHPGLDALTPERQAKISLPTLRERGKRARKLHERLFGAEGTAFTQRAYIEQVESTDALLRLIEEDGLAAEIEATLGPELLPILLVCQDQYDDMVGDRMSRTGSGNDDFNHLRKKLRWKIERYCNALETLRDDEEPDSYALVDKALLSLTLLNQRMSRAAGTNEDEELLGEGLVEFDDPLPEPPAPIEPV